MFLVKKSTFKFEEILTEHSIQSIDCTFCLNLQEIVLSTQIISFQLPKNDFWHLNQLLECSFLPFSFMNDSSLFCIILTFCLSRLYSLKFKIQVF